MRTKEQYIQLLSNFKETNGSSFGIARLGIFGSVARGEQNEESDIDIYYVGEPLSIIKLIELKNLLEKILESKVDIIRLRSSMNLSLKKKIEKEGLYV